MRIFDFRFLLLISILLLIFLYEIIWSSPLLYSSMFFSLLFSFSTLLFLSYFPLFHSLIFHLIYQQLLFFHLFFFKCLCVFFFQFLESIKAISKHTIAISDNVLSRSLRETTECISKQMVNFKYYYLQLIFLSFMSYHIHHILWFTFHFLFLSLFILLFSIFIDINF